MIPVDSLERNCIYTTDKCLDLPACQKMNEQFQTIEVISCYEMTDDEIVVILKQTDLNLYKALRDLLDMAKVIADEEGDKK